MTRIEDICEQAKKLWHEFYESGQSDESRRTTESGFARRNSESLWQGNINSPFVPFVAFCRKSQDRLEACPTWLTPRDWQNASQLLPAED